MLSRPVWDDKEHFRFCFGFKQSVLGLQTAHWVTAGSVLIRGKTTAGVKEVTLAQNPWYHILSCLSHHNFINYRVLEMVGKCWSQLMPKRVLPSRDSAKEFAPNPVPAMSTGRVPWNPMEAGPDWTVMFRVCLLRLTHWKTQCLDQGVQANILDLSAGYQLFSNFIGLRLSEPEGSSINIQYCAPGELSKNLLLKRCNTAQKITAVLLPGNHWSIKELTWSVMNAIAEKSLTSDWQMILIPPLFFFFQFTSEDSTLRKRAIRQPHEAFLKYQCQQTFFLTGNLSYTITRSS